MRNVIGDVIEKRPWFIVFIILLITIGFSLVLPSLQFKTDFKDFAPNNTLVKANDRIAQYFGTSQDIVFLIISKNQAESTITPQSLRNQETLQKNLLFIPQVVGTVSITTFVDTVCQFEFNKTIENCTDMQLQTAIHDLLTVPVSGPTQVIETNTTGFVSTLKTQPDLSTQILRCFVEKNSTAYMFSISVRSLSDLPSPIKPTVKNAHIMEWYIGFENLLAPPGYNIQYQLAARIEPSSPLWTLGNGLFNNLRLLNEVRQNHSLFNSYRVGVYLWLRLPGQSLSIPIELSKSHVVFNQHNASIDIIVSSEDLAQFGIAPHYGSYRIPSKLTNFTAGVRYYQTPLLHRPGGRFYVNTSYLFTRLNRIQTRPILGKIVGRFLQKNNMNWSDIENVSSMAKNGMLPSTLSLSDLSRFWKSISQLPAGKPSSMIYPILPALFDDLRINAESFISKDYQVAGNPSKSIILLDVALTNNTDESAKVDSEIMSRITTLSSSLPAISVQVTGQNLISAQINEVTLSANQFIIPMIIIIIMIILFISYRKPSYVLLSVLVFILSSIWVLGSMALLRIPFSIIAVAIIPLLIGLGVEYSVVFFYNYRNEREKGKTSIGALRQTFSDVGVSISLAWTTMFIAFISFVTATVPPVRDFGFLLALGVSYSFILTMTLSVSLRYIIDRKKGEVFPQKIRHFSLKHVMNRVSQDILRHEKIIFLLVVIISLFMVFGATQLQTRFSTEEFIPKDNQALRLLNGIAEDFPFSSQEQEFFLIEGDVATVPALEGISHTIHNLQDDAFVARKTDGSIKEDSIYSYIQQALSDNSSLASVYHVNTLTGIPASDADVKQLYDYLYSSDQYGPQVKSVLYKGPNGYTATVIDVYINTTSSKNNNDEAKFQILENELNADISNYGKATVTITGNFLISLTIITSLTESQIVSTAVCFLLAAIILILIYRNPLLGLITMIPVSISILWILGTMYYIGYSLNVLTITVTSITIGVGVDYGIYITHRFRLVARQTGDPEEALKEAISLTGSSVFIAAFSSMMGFAILLFAPIPPQQQFGLITAITLSYSLLISIMVLPLVLVHWASWRKKKNHSL